MRLIQQAGPPANSVTRLTPEKEEENTQKSVEESETLNSIKELTGNIYFAVDNKNDTDFGQNGFLSADRFKSGDCLPLLNDKIQENLDLPKLEFCGDGDCNQARNDSLEDKNNANVDDLWSAVEEGRALETKGINKIEPNNHWTFHQNIQNNKNIEKENLTSKLNNIGINTITTIAPSITSNTTTTTTATTLGNNRHQLFDTNRLNFNDQTLLYLPPQNISPQNRQIQIDREKTLKKRRKQHSKDKGLIIKPQEEPGYVGYEDVDVIMKAMGFEQPQQSQRSQKATSPGNGVNIGSSIISNNLSINCNSSTKKQLKKQKQKPRQQQNKNNSIKHEINTSINGDKHQSNTSSSLDGNVVEMDVEEEMDVEIELDTVDEPKQQDIVEDINKSIEEIKTLENDNKKIENEQIKQLEEFKEEKEILNKNIEEEQNKGNNQQIKQKEEKEKPKWVSSKLEENKRLWKQKIDETPLIKRIPKSLLNSLGWRNPITIISPFANRNNNQSIDKEEANKIWKQNPAPENFLEKTIIEQKFIQNKTKQKGGGGGHSGGGRGGGGHFRQTQQRKQMSTNRRAMN